MAKKVEVKATRTNPGKKEEYLGKQLGHSTSSGNPDVNVFEGKDERVAPDTPTEIGGTRHSQIVAAPGASPNRLRFSEPKLIKENGSTHIAHVTSAGKKEI